jgi:crossover junction endodeoxyribonuclease RuvC
MNILGIDPGTIKCGYAIVCKTKTKFFIKEAGLLEFEDGSIAKKILELDKYLSNIFATHDIDDVAIEDIFYAYNPKSFIKLSQFRGAICMKVVQEKGIFYEYTPLQVKKAVTGNGKSKKEQVSFMISSIFKLPNIIKPYDVSDAIAVAVTHSQRIKV